MEEGGEIRFSKKKILEMDYGNGPQHAQLYFDGRIQMQMSSIALKRILKYEEQSGKSNWIVVECIREGETERKREIKNKWRENRKTAMERYELGKGELAKIRKESENDIGKVISRITE